MTTRLVVDSSVVVKWLLPEPDSETAAKVLDLYQEGTASFLVPDLMYAEVGNVLWKRWRKENIEIEDFYQAIAVLLELNFDLRPTADLLPHALQVATRYGRTVYDSLYLALSQKESAPFVTADKRLFNAVRDSLDHIFWLGDWPTFESHLGSKL